MKRLTTILLTIAILCAAAVPAAALPGIYTVVLDASGSVSESDFKKENAPAATLVTLLHAASQTEANLGELADFFSVAWFGGNGEYTQLPYFNVSHRSKVDILAATLPSVEHPKYGNTAIYTALLKATASAIKMEEDLGGTYQHVIILVTDGKDNQSPFKARKLMKRLYPNNKIFLSVIGVGPDADVAEFKQIADDVRHIDDFAELAAVFTLYSGLLR